MLPNTVLPNTVLPNTVAILLDDCERSVQADAALAQRLFASWRKAAEEFGVSALTIAVPSGTAHLLVPDDHGDLFDGSCCTLSIIEQGNGRQRLADLVAEYATLCARDPSASSAYPFDRFMDERLPPVDFIIATGGQRAMCDTFNWAVGYAEFAFADETWRQFDAACLGRTFKGFLTRQRRFGGLIASAAGAKKQTTQAHVMAASP